MQEKGRGRALDVAVGFLALCILTFGALRFGAAGFLPATRQLFGDFQAGFPTAYFAVLRPDFDTSSVWPGWNYGPMFHFVTLPLLLVPRWSMVPSVWAVTNLLALTASFVLICRLSQVQGIRWRGFAILAGLWLLYQPLVNCFRQGNIEILEIALILTAIVALPRASGRMSGVLIGTAAMIKILPIGFLAWFLVRRKWQAVLAGVVTIAVIAAVTTVTLGWKDSIQLQLAGPMIEAPVAGLHELSVTSLFMHRAGVLDIHVPEVRWIPSERAAVASRAGQLASALLAIGYAVVLFLRRQRPISALEVSVLFMTMFMILPWNHDYYYVFALVPFTVLFFRGLARRDAWLLALTGTAYLLISPPVPFSWIDWLGWLPLSFAYVINYLDLPVVGGLLVWAIATHQMFVEQEEIPPQRILHRQTVNT